MSTTELKEAILSKSFGGVLYDITEGSELNTLVRNNDAIALVLAKNIDENPSSNGIDKGVKNFIMEVLA